jgi:hypothetical protein
MYNFCCLVFSRSKFFIDFLQGFPRGKRFHETRQKKSFYFQINRRTRIIYLLEVCVCVAGESIPEVFSIFILSYAASKVMTARSRRKFFFAHQMALNFTRSDDDRCCYNLVSFCWFLGYERPLLFLSFNKQNNLGCCCCCCTFFKCVFLPIPIYDCIKCLV